METSISTARIERIAVEQTYPLRLLVLRPDGKLADCYFDGDMDSTTFHLGVKLGESILSVASFMQNKHSEWPETLSLQLRGMATHPDAQGKGYGKLLVQKSIIMARDLGYQILWCNARLIAVPFYQNLGFQTIGAPFEIGTIGIHYVMWLPINA